MNDPTPGQPASLSVNGDALQPLLDDAARAVEKPAVNARFAWDGAHLSALRTSQDGRALDQQTARDVLSVQLLAGARTIQLPMTTVPPAVTSDDGGAGLGVRELIEQSGRRVITLDHGRITDEKVATPPRAPRSEALFGIGG